MINFNLVSNNAAASAVFIEQEAVNRGKGSALIPHKILVPGQFNTGFSPEVNKPQLIITKENAWERYGRGSMLSIMIELILKNSGGVPVYALPLADGTGVAASKKHTITGIATESGVYSARIAGKKIAFAVSVGDTFTVVAETLAAMITADLDIPSSAVAVAGVVTETVNWKGESGNQILFEINPDDSDITPAGLTVLVEDDVAGTLDPDLSDALEALGNTWFTEIAMPYNSDDALKAMEAVGVSRNDPGTMRQFAGIVGYTDTKENFITDLGKRNSEWTTFVPVHGSPTPDFIIAASTAAIFARHQQANPGRPLKGLVLPGVIAGSSNDLVSATRDLIVKSGGSHTYNQENGTITVGDLCTTRTKTDAGAETTDWRFTIIIPNLQFKIYALEQMLKSPPFDRGVVVADGGGIGPTYTVRPSTVKTYAIGLVDDWIERGLACNRDEIVSNIIAEIDSDNPGRINLLIPDIPSSGLRILAGKVEWAFLV